MKINCFIQKVSYLGIFLIVGLCVGSDESKSFIATSQSSKNSAIIEEAYEEGRIDFLDEINNNDTLVEEESRSIPFFVLVGAAFKMVSVYCCEIPLQKIKRYYGTIVKPELKKQWNHYTVQKNEEQE